MKAFCCATLCFFTLVLVAKAQFPPRLTIPGAIPIPQQQPQNIPLPYRQTTGVRYLQQQEPPQLVYQRSRRPIVPIRPVIEENDDKPSSNFEDEVNKLGISALQSAVRQAEDVEAPARPNAPTPIQFRPERPVPISRQDIRENYPSERPAQQRQRQEYREPQVQQTRAQQPQQQRAQHRPQHKIHARPLEDDEEELNRKRKPVPQILRKYRTDNADGSITWGFENDDGTFKEENIGVDCVIRGKYGYVDPDGVKREYSYESGNPCDKTLEEEEDEDLPPRNQQQAGGRRENIPQNNKKIQYRPISQN